MVQCPNELLSSKTVKPATVTLAASVVSICCLQNLKARGGKRRVAGSAQAGAKLGQASAYAAAVLLVRRGPKGIAATEGVGSGGRGEPGKTIKAGRKEGWRRGLYGPLEVQSMRAGRGNREGSD